MGLSIETPPKGPAVAQGTRAPFDVLFVHVLSCERVFLQNLRHQLTRSINNRQRKDEIRAHLRNAHQMDYSSVRVVVDRSRANPRPITTNRKRGPHIEFNPALFQEILSDSESLRKGVAFSASSAHRPSASPVYPVLDTATGTYFSASIADVESYFGIGTLL